MLYEGAGGLLRVGLDACFQTRYFGCPLQMASQFGSFDIVETLPDLEPISIDRRYGLH